jgi:hypothetical protein
MDNSIAYDFLIFKKKNNKLFVILVMSFLIEEKSND